MKKLKTAFYLNICVVILEVFANGWMMLGAGSGVLTATRIEALKFFTVDSNILMGVAALMMAIEIGQVLRGEKEEVAPAFYVISLAGTVSVTLTMLVTTFFLAPRAKSGFFSLFAGSNLFLHLVNPVLSIILFTCFEKTDKIAFGHTFTGIIPMVIYAVYYVAVTLNHMTDGVIARGYDWYGFFYNGIKSAVVVLPIMFVVTWLSSFLEWKWNRAGVTVAA